MKILNVTQGSEEWLRARAQYNTASEAPAMMGKSKYLTRSALLKQKATGLAEEVNEATQALFDRGHASESGARAIAERIIGDELFPATAIDDDGRFLASFDGVTMMEDVIWEHKLINDALRSATLDTLEEHYKIQMDHQLLVSGADRCLFMASDGTEEDCVHFWYKTTPERLRALKAGWEQFDHDLSDYQPEAPVAPTPAGVAPETLPALHIEVTGMVKASNLEQFKQAAIATFEGINTNLQTDQDFADAEEAVKFCKDAESRLDAAKENALGQTATIDELFRTIDQIRDLARSRRLELEKLVKARKDAIRGEILNDHEAMLREHIDALNKRIAPVSMPPYRADFAGAMKGKKTVQSLRDACADRLAQSKIDLSSMADEASANMKALDELGDYGFLFDDLQQIAFKPAEDFLALAKLRIADHEQKAKEREEAERERIRVEEERKARQKMLDEQKAKEPKSKAEEPTPMESERPADGELVAVLAAHYGVPRHLVIGWLSAFDADSAFELEVREAG